MYLPSDKGPTTLSPESKDSLCRSKKHFRGDIRLKLMNFAPKLPYFCCIYLSFPRILTPPPRASDPRYRYRYGWDCCKTVNLAIQRSKKCSKRYRALIFINTNLYSAFSAGRQANIGIEFSSNTWLHNAFENVANSGAHRTYCQFPGLGIFLCWNIERHSPSTDSRYNCKGELFRWLACA
jgi:hypothetical protein